MSYIFVYFSYDRQKCFTYLISLILANVCSFVSTGDGGNNNKIDCLVNSTIGYSDLKNIYQCSRPMKCCYEYSKPSCCNRKPSIQIIKEQLTLWGGLFAILFCLASIVYCRKKDINFPACLAFKHCLIHLCCGHGSSERPDKLFKSLNHNPDPDNHTHHEMKVNIQQQNDVIKILPTTIIKSKQQWHRNQTKVNPLPAPKPYQYHNNSTLI